jgi:hypothetical protein
VRDLRYLDRLDQLDDLNKVGRHCARRLADRGQSL